MRYLILSLLIAISAPAIAKKVDETLAVERAGKVGISVVRGDVDVMTWKKSEVRVVGELDDAVRKFIFETDKGETRIKVELDDGFFHKGWSSEDTDLDIFVPQDSEVETDGVSVDYKIIGVKGGLRANTVSGDLDISEIEKELDLQTVSGDIRVMDSSGRMKLSSVSGDIDTDGDAEFFDATTVSGDVEASIGRTGVLELSSVSGDLEIKFELADDGRVDAETVSGDVSLEFGNSVVNARFKIDTGPGGDIRNRITDDRSDESFIGSEKIKFESGNGDGTVEISTMSGTIEVEN